MNLDCDDKSPGRPIVPIPLLYKLRSNSLLNLFSGDLGDDKFEITIYTSCCNVNKGIYYYTTYDNHQITAVDMHKENLDSNVLIRYPLIKEEQIRTQN